MEQTSVTAPRVVRRWRLINAAVHYIGVREIHLIHDPDGQWTVRPVGRITQPETGHNNESLALVRVTQLMGHNMMRRWVEVEAQVGPPVRYGAAPGGDRDQD